MSTTLQQHDRTIDWLWDFGWFQVTHFLVTAPQPWDLTVLQAALLAHPGYGVSYGLPPMMDHGGGDTHGPFFIARLQPTDFVPCTPAIMLEQVQQVLHDPAFTEPPEAAQQAAVLDQVTHLLDGARATFRLGVTLADTDYQPDWAFHLLFEEWLVVHEATQRLYVCVIGYD